MKTQNSTIQNYPSFFSQLIKWWFIVTPKNIYFGMIQIIENTYNFFSIMQLVKTLFSPWRRDILEGKNLSLSQRIQLGVMNIISRFMGALIRSITIFTGLVIIFMEFIIGFLWLFIFILSPFIGLAFLIMIIL